MWFIFISLLALVSHQVLTLDLDPDLQRNAVKFGYGVHFKYEGQLYHSIDRYYMVAKFHLPKVRDIPMIFRRMPIDYNNCEYLSRLNGTTYGHMWGDVKNGHV